MITVPSILLDPCASYWLKAAVRSATARDPVDALSDAEALVDALRARLRDVQHVAEFGPPTTPEAWAAFLRAE